MDEEQAFSLQYPASQLTLLYMGWVKEGKPAENRPESKPFEIITSVTHWPPRAMDPIEKHKDYIPDLNSGLGMGVSLL